MSDKIISRADLSSLNRSIRTISSDMSTINKRLGNIDSKQDLLENELETVNLKQDQLGDELFKFATAFAEYVEADMKQKALQLAETRQGNLKQDLQIKFGYYAEVRRMATGILQAVDTGVVSDETLKSSTEGVMIKAPGYWLAPALVALASWIRNNKETTEKAVNEAMKRDDYKTTLFFMLVMRRLTRNEASLQWLERYFMHQNPHNLDREFLIILEAVVTGVFPPASKQLMKQNVKNWLDQLTEGDEYINEQKAQWVSFFEAMAPLDEGKYPQLGKFATNWNDLENSLKEARTHAVLHSHFNDVVSLSSDFSKNTKVQLDEILSLLVTNFDDEELPLQEQVRLNELIIEMEGDKEAAQKRMDSEKLIFNENVDFLQMLTNASFNPELSGVTKVSQALAISISQPWIVEAYNSFTEQCRNRIPQAINLKIEGFETSTANGSDEKELIDQHSSYYKNILATELKKLSFPVISVVIGILVGLAGVYVSNFNQTLGPVVIGIGGICIISAFYQHSKAKKAVRKQVAQRELEAREVLRECIVEVVDYRKEHACEDARAGDVGYLLNSITPEEFSSVSKETERSLV
ncbi:MAG: hypothetical protein ACEPOZ_06150 [Marinifilaceae bacterium]